jgi:hypothetical protein
MKAAPRNRCPKNEAGAVRLIAEAQIFDGSPREVDAKPLGEDAAKLSMAMSA